MVSAKIRILLGGSPCTHWSIAQTKNRETEPSGMGWELFHNYLVALQKYKPDYFLYENNKSMSPAIRAQITKELGVEPVLINSALVSAQSRQRLYWFGKRNPDGTYSQVDVAQPEDRGILLRDILESCIPIREKAYTLKANYGRGVVAEPVGINRLGGLYGQHTRWGIFGVDGKVPCLTASADMGGGHLPMYPIRVGTIESDAKNADFDSQQYRVYSPDGKSVTLCGQGGGVGAKTGLYAAPVRVGDMPTKSGKITGSQNARIYDADGKAATLTARPNGGGVDGPLYATPVCVGHKPKQNGDLVDHQSTRIYSVDGKGITMTAKANGGGCDGSTTGWYAVPAGMARRGRGDSSAFEMRDDQKANAVIVGHQSRLVIEAADGKTYPVYEVRDGLITIKGQQYPIKLADGYYIIRKLTVRECMRLQTVPEWYQFPVSDTQAYKMLGNGWTVDVIAHILSHIPGIDAEPVEVLSMYDGMSCGHIALDKLGANVVRYCATEIDKYAIKTTLENYPDTVQLGDAYQVLADDWDGGGIIKKVYYKAKR